MKKYVNINNVNISIDQLDNEFKNLDDCYKYVIFITYMFFIREQCVYSSHQINIINERIDIFDRLRPTITNWKEYKEHIGYIDGLYKMIKDSINQINNDWREDINIFFIQYMNKIMNIFN